HRCGRRNIDWGDGSLTVFLMNKRSGRKKYQSSMRTVSAISERDFNSCVCRCIESGVGLDGERELRDVQVAVDAKIAGYVILLLGLDGRTAKLMNGANEQLLMFLVIGTVLQAQSEHRLADLALAELLLRSLAVSTTAPTIQRAPDAWTGQRS